MTWFFKNLNITRSADPIVTFEIIFYYKYTTF